MNCSTVMPGVPDHAFWRVFLAVCAVPHPSGHEEKVRALLAALAAKAGLRTRTDSAGNLAIDRPAAPGLEDVSTVILQGHMDMVPQAAEGVEFDFERDPVRPVVADGWVGTGGRTTLGADDGVALAGAMELLLDETLICGPLRAVFTVGEETGLNGASGIDPAFLEGGALLNLDGSGKGFTIGCAGGARVEGVLALGAVPVPAGHVGVKVAVRDLPGGHSGEDIHRARGNAIAVLGEVMKRFPDLAASEIHGGTVDNAIPRDASLYGALPEAEFASLEAFCAELAATLERTLEHAPERPVRVEALAVPVPDAVWRDAERRAAVELLTRLPRGVQATNPDGSVATSANLAIADGTAGGELRLVMHCRSVSNEERRKLSARIETAMREVRFAARLVSEYSGWTPRFDAPLTRRAGEIYRELFGRDPEFSVIHGGLETGIFSGLKPELPMLSFAPEIEGLHSPAERLNIASVEDFRRLLRALVTGLWKR